MPTMIPSFFKQHKDNIEAESPVILLQLTALKEFIHNQENSNTLFKGKDGGEICFDTFKYKHFNSQNDISINLLDSVMTNFQTNLRKLQTIDFKISLSFTFGLVAIALSPLSMGLTTLLSAAAFSFVGYLYKSREIAREDYEVAQEQMTDVYIWSMNDTKAYVTKDGKKLPEKGNTSDKVYASIIQNELHPKIKMMHDLVNPLLSDQNIRHYTRNSLANAITAHRSDTNQLSVKSETTTKLQLSLNYLFYGQHQGGTMQVAKGIAELSRRTVVELPSKVASVFKSTKTPDTISFTQESPTLA